MSFSGSERDEKLVPNKSDDLSDKSLRTFYCREQGCANELKGVFCGEDSLFEVDQTIEHCRGPPELNQICQQDSRAYVTTTENRCDFERKVGNPYFSTSECTDQNPSNSSDVTTLPPPLYNNNGTDIGAGGNRNPCNWSDVTTLPPPLYNNNGTDIGAGGSTPTPPGNNHAVYGLIGVGGVVVVVLLICCFFIYRCLKKKCKNNNWINGRIRNETNGIPMQQRNQVGNGNNGTISEPEHERLHPQVELDTIV